MGLFKIAMGIPFFLRIKKGEKKSGHPAFKQAFTLTGIHFM